MSSLKTGKIKYQTSVYTVHLENPISTNKEDGFLVTYAGIDLLHQQKCPRGALFLSTNS